MPLDAFPSRRCAGLALAGETMTRGLDFLGRRLAAAPASGNLVRSYADARLIGNELRELDAFLIVLLDEAAACLGADERARRRLAQRRNAHARLSAMLHALGAERAVDPRLCATAAMRDCLHARGGRVAGGSHPAPALALHRLGAGVTDGAILLPAASLRSIHALYRAASEQLVAAVEAWPGHDIDFSRLSRHLGCAIVACGGF